MTTSWITLFPQWYVSQRDALARHYPQFKVYQPALKEGELVLYGELEVRPQGGTVKHPVILEYPAATPFEKPIVRPVVSLPELDESGRFKAKAEVKFFDHRHQMPRGELCLFQREARLAGGDVVTGVQSLARAEQWFLGHHTGHWPPDSAECELESHLLCVTNVLIGETFFRGRRSRPNAGLHGLSGISSSRQASGMVGAVGMSDGMGPPSRCAR